MLIQWVLLQDGCQLKFNEYDQVMKPGLIYLDCSRYDGVCDKDGCDFASYRHGDKSFFGRGSGNQ